MSANKTLMIRFEDWESFKNRVTGALKSRKPSIGKKNTILFASVTDYQKFMTEQKIAILAAIIKKAPPSIYQLAQLVERADSTPHWYLFDSGQKYWFNQRSPIMGL